MTRWVKLLALVVLGGCAHHSSETRQPIAARTEAKPMPAQSTTPACTVDGDCGLNQLCIRQQCLAVTPDLSECAMMRVHFSFDSAEIDAADKSSLERSARCLKADHALHVTIEGNADERGTEEYNLALGDRRATAVSTWLLSLGTSDTQLKTVSYGKENPLCTAHDEACWAKNRRASVKPKVSAADQKKVR